MLARAHYVTLQDADYVARLLGHVMAFHELILDNWILGSLKGMFFRCVLSFRDVCQCAYQRREVFSRLGVHTREIEIEFPLRTSL